MPLPRSTIRIFSAIVFYRPVTLRFGKGHFSYRPLSHRYSL